LNDLPIKERKAGPVIYGVYPYLLVFFHRNRKNLMPVLKE